MRISEFRWLGLIAFAWVFLIGPGNIEGKWFTDINKGREIIDIITNLLNEYFKNPLAKTVLNVRLSFFATSYSKLLLEIFNYLETKSQIGHSIEINWFCKFDDEDFIETGEDFKAILKIPFNICEY